MRTLRLLGPVALFALLATTTAHAGPDCDDAAQPAATKPKPKPKIQAPKNTRGCVSRARQSGDPMGEMEVVDLQVNGPFHPGETITVTATVAEVTGLPNLAYPGITLLVEPGQQLDLRPHTRYGVEGCGQIQHTWTFKLPAEIPPGTAYRITAIAGSRHSCKDPHTCDADRRTVTRVLTLADR